MVAGDPGGAVQRGQELPGVKFALGVVATSDGGHALFCPQVLGPAVSRT
jgi:hypothetical protein